MQMKEEYNDIDGLITSYLSGNLDKASFPSCRNGLWNRKLTVFMFGIS